MCLPFSKKKTICKIFPFIFFNAKIMPSFRFNMSFFLGFHFFFQFTKVIFFSFSISFSTCLLFFKIAKFPDHTKKVRHQNRAHEAEIKEGLDIPCLFFYYCKSLFLDSRGFLHKLLIRGRSVWLIRLPNICLQIFLF